MCINCRLCHTLVNDCLTHSLRPIQSGRHFPDDIFKCIFLNENVSISMKISLNFVPNDSINNPALVQIMAWRRSGDKPLSEPMMVNLLTHICVTRPQWVKVFRWLFGWPAFFTLKGDAKIINKCLRRMTSMSRKRLYNITQKPDMQSIKCETTV